MGYEPENPTRATTAAVALPKQLSAIIEQAESAAFDFELPTELFHYRIGWMASYGDLLAEIPSRESVPRELIRVALTTGRVLLAGRGGAGKTIVLQRLRQEALKRGFLIVYLELRRWTGQDYEKWQSLNENSDRLSFLLQRFGHPSVSLPELNAFDGSVPIVLIADALNEVTVQAGSSIIEALDYFAKNYSNSGVIVADRLARRYNVSSWSLATVLPIGEAEVSRYLAANFVNPAKALELPLLRIPFFLNQYLQSGTLPSNSAAALGQYFESVVKLSGDEKNLAAEAGYVCYSSTGSRTFDLLLFEAVAGDLVTTKLLSSGALAIDEGSASFDHHLKHDFLAASWLELNPDLWNAVGLDVLTFRSSSFDALPLALEQADTGEADSLLAAIYDWNQYGAAYALAESLRHGACSVSTEMRTVILAALAEKRWDLVKATAQRASDSLSDFPDEARLYGQFNTISELIAYVSTIQSDLEWFQDWKQLFCHPAGSVIDDEQLRLIADSSPVLGWTAANVLKRVTLLPRQQTLLRDTLPQADEVISWRIAHVLGAYPVENNMRALLGLFEEHESELVRLGAIRSLVENGAKGSPRIRQRVFSQIARRTSILWQYRRVREEFLRAIFVTEYPTDWATHVMKVLVRLYETLDAEPLRDQWRKILYQFHLEYDKSAA